MTTTTTAPLPAPTTRLLRAAPLTDPDAFARSITALTGRTPRLSEMRGFVGRNDNWLVPTPPDGDLFVKCLRGPRDQLVIRMARVAAFERLVADAPPETFRTPAYHGADELRGMLVFDCLPDSRAASDLFADDELAPATVFEFGRIVAEIHRLPHTSIGVDDAAGGGRAVTSFYALDAESYANCSGGEVEAWAMLQHDKLVLKSLSAMQASSAQAPAVASHGDLRLDQFLLDAAGAVYLVDWEEFRYADPARDVGAVVGEFLHHAASRMFAELDVEAGLQVPRTRRSWPRASSSWTGSARTLISSGPGTSPAATAATTRAWRYAPPGTPVGTSSIDCSPVPRTARNSVPPSAGWPGSAATPSPTPSATHPSSACADRFPTPARTSP
jgi:hypothetical protein